MKGPISNIVIVFCVLVFSSFGRSRAVSLPSEPLYTKEKIALYIREVFAEQADASVLKNSKSKRMLLITDFFNRIQIKNKPGYRDKKITLLSEVKLRETDNPNLKRDLVFDPENFNALKYNFPMAAKEKKLYRVDNTDYLIAINPKQ